MRADRSYRQAGFTLIEALVVIVIVGTLLGLAAPSFVTFTAGQKVKTASFELYAALAFARSEALKRRVTVTVAAADGTDWKNGWTVTATGVVTPLRSQDPLSGVITTTTSGSGATVSYRSDGRPDTATPSLFVLIQPQSADSSIQNRCVQVRSSGMAKTTTTSGTTCP